MRISILRETTWGEARVSAVPSAVRALVAAGHSVLVEQHAGLASGFADDEYIRAGAEISPTAEEAVDRAELIWKVLPPSDHEARLLRPGQRVAALFHALPTPTVEGVTRVALEADPAVRVAMGEIGGRLAVEAASVALQRQNGGRGLLLGGLPGVEAARVCVLGAGTAGAVAARLAAAMGAGVDVLDVDVDRLRALHSPGLRTRMATAHQVERALADADVVVAAVRTPDGAPRLATRAHLALMQPGAVVVDLSILDGGAFESTPRTTLDAPTAIVDGIVHIGVPNLAGAVPRTASVALSQAAFPVVRAALG
jgi:alanine dehydrogenase